MSNVYNVLSESPWPSTELFAAQSLEEAYTKREWSVDARAHASRMS